MFTFPRLENNTVLGISQFSNRARVSDERVKQRFWNRLTSTGLFDETKTRWNFLNYAILPRNCEALWSGLDGF